MQLEFTKVEERPYKSGMSHPEAMAILRKMGAAGQLDEQIIADIDQCHADHCEARSGVSQASEQRAARRYLYTIWRTIWRTKEVRAWDAYL